MLLIDLFWHDVEIDYVEPTAIRMVAQTNKSSHNNWFSALVLVRLIVNSMDVKNKALRLGTGAVGATPIQ